jgi:hypothetical protein
MAFTVTMLSWSVVEFGDGTPRQLEHARAAVRWGGGLPAQEAMAAPDAVYVQVGDPYQDHRCWERPEDMHAHPAERVQGHAAEPRVRRRRRDRDGDGGRVPRVPDMRPGYSSMLLRRKMYRRHLSRIHRARGLTAEQRRVLSCVCIYMQAFDFADRYRGSYSDSLSSVACPFYCSYSGYQVSVVIFSTAL